MQLPLDYKPEVPKNKSRGIGIIGAGRIVENCHIPAYQAAGLNIVGITSRSGERARGVAQRRGIAKVYADVDELLADPKVEVVDIAYPPHCNLELVRKAAAAGKHILVQKPMADTLDSARAIVATAKQAGVKLAVHQNGRWDPALRSARTLIRQGYIGKPIVATIELRFPMQWQEYYDDPRYVQLMILNMSVHHIDQLRMIFGDPARVWASTTRWPGQRWHGETIAFYNLEYDSGLIASCWDDGFTWTNDTGINYRFEGTEGVIKGTIGWPTEGPSTLVLFSKKTGDQWIEPVFADKWFPDGFLGPMGSLLKAIEEGGEAETGGDDNLRTLQVVFAAYRSAEEKRAVRPDEV